ncbi:MAG: hypothetical protein JXQ82_09895 [Methanomicrobiaceae archaeon]|nr:hypothetical protein [Methanomicrobiaceae archaeon]
MEKGKIAVVILVIALIACGGYIIYKNYPGILNPANSNAGAVPAGETYVTYQTTEGSSPQETQTTYQTTSVSSVSNGVVYATPSAIKSMDLDVEPVDWDSVIGNDGIVIHFRFYDEYGRQVIFSGSTLDCEINVLTPQTDTLMRNVNPRKVLYKGYTSITSSDQGEGSSLAGIRVAYSDLNMGQYDRGIGQVKVKTSLPTGGTITGEETFLYTRH